MLVTGVLLAFCMVALQDRRNDLLVGTIVGSVVTYWLPARFNDAPARATDVGPTPPPPTKGADDG